MERAYSVYGLSVVADGGIPGLAPAAINTDFDVRIWLNRLPPWWDAALVTAEAVWYSSPPIDERGQVRMTVWRVKTGWYRIRYYDGSEFVVAPEGGEIWCSWPPGIAPEEASPYLTGPVMGFVLRLRGVCCLHASAVRIGQKVIALCGSVGAGKSTTAAAFGKLGYAVVSDDISALVERGGVYLVQPGYPRVCLWPAAAAALYGPSVRLPRITPEGGIKWDKRYLDLTSDGYQFQSRSLPLSAIYLLGERADGAAQPAIEAVPASAALVKMAANTYMNYLLDTDLRSREFVFLSKVVSQIPVRHVTPQADPSCLPQLCEAILEDHRQFSNVLNA